MEPKSLRMRAWPSGQDRFCRFRRIVTDSCYDEKYSQRVRKNSFRRIRQESGEEGTHKTENNKKTVHT